jgi:hypothetical protein
MSPRALAATLPKLTKPVLERHGRAYATLIAEWTSIAGPALAAMSLPEKLSPGGPNAHGGTLTIRVAGAAATEIQHLAPQIIERINTCLGFGAVARLKVVQGPLPGRAPRRSRVPPLASPEAKAAIESATAGIADEPLRAALARFGEAVVAESAAPDPGPGRLRRSGKAL